MEAAEIPPESPGSPPLELAEIPPKWRYKVMLKDDTLWEQLDKEVDEWEEAGVQKATYRAVGDFILTFKPAPAEIMHKAIKGGYNAIYRMEYKDGSSVIMKVPIKGQSPDPDEKMRYEAATMRYVAANTTIPVPHVYHYGTAAENPTGLGPFIIMDYIKHDLTMCKTFLEPATMTETGPTLAAVVDDKLDFFYSQIADILLQLSSLRLPRIGSLVEDEDGGVISVKGRPLTMNMTDIAVLTSAPSSILPNRTYASAHEWYSDLADMHMAQVEFQHNDAVDDADDARDKYVARQLFRRLAAERRLAPGLPGSSGSDDDADGDDDKDDEGGEFILYSEDLRAGNILVDFDLRVVGIIDWEFVYAAPAQFSYDPPWWLIKETPDWWGDGYEGYMKVYRPRLDRFLRALEAAEEKQKKKEEEEEQKEAAVAELGNLSMAGRDKRKEKKRNRKKTTSGPPLSQRMRESWEKRTWMLNYAAKKSWAFDFLWWRYLDEHYFGPNEYKDCAPRLELLTEPQRSVMEAFVARKVEESKDRKIVQVGDAEAADRLAALLV